jgi:hypothetical protein
MSERNPFIADVEKLPFSFEMRTGSQTLSPNGRMLAVSTSEPTGCSSGRSHQQKKDDGILNNIKLLVLETGEECVMRGHR